MFNVLVWSQPTLNVANSYIANAYTRGEHKLNVLYFIKYMSRDLFYLYFII